MFCKKTTNIHNLLKTLRVAPPPPLVNILFKINNSQLALDVASILENAIWHNKGVGLTCGREPAGSWHGAN